MTRAYQYDKPLPVRIDPELLRRIDALRDLAPREPYINRMLAQALDAAERKAAKR